MTPVRTTLEQLAAAVPSSAIRGDAGAAIAGLFQDSRKVTEGAAFVVRRGQKVDGRAFVADAIARGAGAIVTDDEALAASLAVPVLVVPDAQEAVGPLARAAYGDPFRALEVIGVTGTNGKTTTVHLVRQLLAHLGERCASLGTLGVRFDEHELAGAHTTPEADDLVRTAADLVERGATHLVMEVSSHALSLGRVASVPFRVAGFTNLTHDHLDFHGSFGAYGEAKAKLFTAMAPRASVVHIGDAFGRGLAARAEGDVWRVAAATEPTADVEASDLSTTIRGTRAALRIRDAKTALASPLVGRHNVENLVVSLGVLLALGVPADAAVAALPTATAAPGRLEQVSSPDDDVLVMVDYAHTPDALERVLAALRQVAEKSVWCVFGCGGDRDRDKRPRMGAAAAQLADHIVVTNDNPRSEDPASISDAILVGIRGMGRSPTVILDRREAIGHAVARARPGDVVLIAGKGHEPYQIIGQHTLPFDDRIEARAALSARRGAPS